MASSSKFHPTKLYEPTPRFLHRAASVGGKCYLWGGIVQNFTKSGKKRLASTVIIFDQYLETWEEHTTTGVPPPGLYSGACTSLLDSFYCFSGEDGTSYYNSLHRLDPTTLEWKELQPLNQAHGPMKKAGCGMVPILQGKLATFGGDGIPTGPTQPGAMFTKSTYFDGSGWSNELHIFDNTECKWSSPDTTGPRPPPCTYFSFTAINNHQAVLFGGNHVKLGYGTASNDCYLMDFESMVWTKLERPEGTPWPAERSSHAACCLNYGEEHPQLLVTGGTDKIGNILQDAWILDVMSGRWRKFVLPKDVQPRMWHTATALKLMPGWTQVTMFGGCPKWEQGKSLEALPSLAKTTVLEFKSVEFPSSDDRPPIKKWILVGVATSSQLGSVQRMKEKMVNMQQRANREVEAGRDLQMQLKALQDALEGALQESQQSAERRVQEAGEQVQILRQTVNQANVQIEHLQQRVHA